MRERACGREIAFDICPDIEADRVFGIGARVCTCSHVFEVALHAYIKSFKDKTVRNDSFKYAMCVHVFVRARART